MTLKDTLVDKAVDILLRKNVRDTRDVDGAVTYLEEYAPFDGMETDELVAYAQAALDKLASGAGGHPTSTGGPAPKTAPGRPVPGRPVPGRPASGRGGGAPRELPRYTSPFVFVGLPDQVVPADQEPLDVPRPDGFCATIRYLLEAETPLLVGAEASRQGPDKGTDKSSGKGPDKGVVAPMAMGGPEQYVIPGATIRGLVRTAVEIVAHGKLGSANLHHRFGLRDFDHPYYEQVAKVGRVHAGWLTGAVDGKGNVTGMEIVPCDWAHVLIDDMAAAPEFAGRVTRREDWIGKALNEKYQALGLVQRGGKGAIYDFHETYGYAPPFEDNGRTIRKPAKGGTPGVPVMSDKLPGRGGNKKFEYAFFDRRGARPVEIAPAIVEDFVRLNSKPSKNRPTPDGSWKELKPTFVEGFRIPVFYVGDLETQGPDFFFGLTRMMKLPHRRSVFDVVSKSHPAHRAGAVVRPVDGGGHDDDQQGGDKLEIETYKADFVENLFGYVVEPKDFIDDPASSAPQGIARKGRVAFSFAKLKGDSGPARVSDPVEVIQSAPRASYSPFYLQPAEPGENGGEADYSAVQTPRLAGRKRYRPRDGTADVLGRFAKIRAMGARQIAAVSKSSRGKSVSEEVLSRLRFLLPRDVKKPLIFEGEIRLHNVTAAEIGAVLFALTHGGDPAKPCRHMVGRARPFGAGQMRLRSLDLDAEANDGRAVAAPAPDEMLSADTRTGFCTKDGTAGLKPFLAAFAALMRRQKGLESFPDVPAVREFLGASTPAAEVADADLDYMGLEDFNEVRKAVKPLKPTARGEPRPPARGPATDGRLLGAPPSGKPPVFWS